MKIYLVMSKKMKMAKNLTNKMCYDGLRMLESVALAKEKYG